MNTVWLLAWVGLAISVLWVLLAAIGTPRGTLPRRWKGRAHSAVCGACGHPVVELGRVSRCPECGADYERAGVLTRQAAVRLGPPLALVVLLVISAGVMGWIYLVPWVAGEANRRTIGARDVQVVQRSAILEQDTQPLMIHGYPTGWWRPNPGYSLTIARTLVRPDWPLASGDHALNEDSGVRVKLDRTSGGEFVLLWLPESDEWTLLGANGIESERGASLRLGMQAMFAAAGDPEQLIGEAPVPGGYHGPTVETMRRNEIADAVQFAGELAGKQMIGRNRHRDDGGLVGLADQEWPEVLVESIATHRYHELAPAGVATAWVVRVLIVVVGVTILVVVALVRRRVLAA